MLAGSVPSGPKTEKPVPGVVGAVPEEIEPGTASNPVLGLTVKLATVLGSCWPEVADPDRIE